MDILFSSWILAFFLLVVFYIFNRNYKNTMRTLFWVLSSILILGAVPIHFSLILIPLLLVGALMIQDDEEEEDKMWWLPLVIFYVSIFISLIAHVYVKKNNSAFDIERDTSMETLQRWNQRFVF